MHPEIDSKQNFPRVTVVTAVFNLVSANRVELFRQCMDSVSSQSYPDIEHLIIDGASTDGTLDLLREYNGRNGVRVLSEPDTGIYDAMNKGIAAATGKYIAFLNSDDYWHDPHGVACSVERLERAQADFSYAPCRYIHADGTDVGVSMPELGCAFSLMPFCHQTMFARVDSLREAGGFAADQFSVAADYDMILHLLVSGCKPVFVPLDFTSFRRGGVSFSRAGDTERESRLARRRQLLPLIQESLLEPLEKGFMPQELFLVLSSLLHPAAMASVIDAHARENVHGVRPLLNREHRVVQVNLPNDSRQMDCGWSYSSIFGLPVMRTCNMESGMRLYMLFGCIPVLGVRMELERRRTRWSLFGVLPLLDVEHRNSGTTKWKLFGLLIWRRYPKRR